MKIIPLQSDPPCYRFNATLDGFVIYFRLKWNFTAEQWYLDLDCEELGLSYKGLTLVTGDNILLGRGVAELGALILIDQQGNEDPTREGLGDRWKLYYMTKAEVDAIR
jgi:hypothetical protein